MLATLVEAGVVFLTIAGLSYLVGLAISQVLEQNRLRALQAGGVGDRLHGLQTLLLRFKKRRETLLPGMVRLDAKVKSARRRHYMVTKRIADLAVSRSRLVRVLGEEDAFLRPDRPARRFVAHVINRHVQRAQLEQKEHPFLARSWARSQQVHVWAPTIGDAKLVVERSFPPATGFFIVEIAEDAGQDDTLDRLEEAELSEDAPTAAAAAMARRALTK